MSSAVLTILTVRLVIFYFPYLVRAFVFTQTTKQAALCRVSVRVRL